MKRLKYILVFIILIIPKSVLADSFGMSITCPSTALPSENINCNFSVDNSDFVIDSVDAVYTFNGIQNTLHFEEDNGLIIVLNIPNDAVSNAIYTLDITNIVANNSINSDNISTSIRIKSSDNYLSDLTVSGANIDFDKEITTYDVIINDTKTLIGATANDLSSKIEGTGEKALDYGNNKFKVIVTSETLDKREYIINITRTDDRSKNNYLSNIIVTNANIDFNKYKTEYNLNTTSQDVTISASKDDEKSIVSGDIGRKNLLYGLNKFSITVISENNQKRVYYININRIDNRSNNNYLKNIVLSSGTINFSKTNTTYTIDVDKSVEEITVNAYLEDESASFIEGYGPRKVSLSSGNNTVYLKVLNQKEELRTYTLNINRDDGRKSDSSLKELKISDALIDFNKDKYSYKVSVKYDVDKVKITATPNSDKSKVEIKGSDKLIVGDNLYTITVTAENGAKTIYKITVTRKSEGLELSNNNYIKKLTIKGSNIKFKKDIYEYTVTTNKDYLDINVILDDKNSTYEIINNERLKNKSQVIIRVTSENFDTRDYIINIKKTSNAFIISLMIVTTITTLLLVYYVMIRIKRKAKLHSMYGKRVEIIDEDFTYA